MLRDQGAGHHQWYTDFTLTSKPPPAEAHLILGTGSCAHILLKLCSWELEASVRSEVSQHWAPALSHFHILETGQARLRTLPKFLQA